MLHLTDKTWTLQYAREETPHPEFFFKHSHQNYEILYFVCGDAEYNVEGRFYTLRPHDIVFIPPARFHYLHLQSPAPYERYCFNFEARILPAEDQERLYGLPTVLSAEGNAQLRDCFTRLLGYAKRMREGDLRLLARSSLLEILIYLFYDSPAAEARRERHNPVIEKVIALIDEHPERDWNAETLARELFLSRSYLQNLFSRYMDVGLKNYINTKKILHAQSMLLSGRRATEVCEACGFRDYSTFYRLFCRIIGCSPGSVSKSE